MKQRIIIYTLLTLLAMTVPAMSFAEPTTDPVETETQPIGIEYVNGMLRITGAKGETVYIYNVAGIPVGTIKITSDDETLRVTLRRGGYLVKVGKVTRKIAVTR